MKLIVRKLGLARHSLLYVLLFTIGTVTAQEPTAPTVLDTAKLTYNQISHTMGLYVFPAKSQSQAQQKKDEYECYNWAVEQSGIDPLKIHPSRIRTYHSQLLKSCPDGWPFHF